MPADTGWYLLSVTYAEKFTGTRRIPPDPVFFKATAPPHVNSGSSFLALCRPRSLSSPRRPCPLALGVLPASVTR